MLSLLLLALAPASPIAASPPNPRTAELFERDPALMAWALRSYDANRDGWLTLFEAQRGADAFRDIADSDRDGRITTSEYRDTVIFRRATLTSHLNALSALSHGIRRSPSGRGISSRAASAIHPWYRSSNAG